MKTEIIRKKFPPPEPVFLEEKLPSFLATLDPCQAAEETESLLLFSGNQKRFFVYDGSLPESVWFIGDIHADAGDLAWAFKYIFSTDKELPHIVFLGDFIDRGTQPAAVFTLILSLIFERKIKALMLAGNHDSGFTFDPSNRRFDSNVIPCDFSDLLNMDLRRSAQREALQFYGRFWTCLVPKLKIGLLLPGGIYAAHAGFVKQGQLPKLAGFLENPGQDEYSKIRFDLVWMRYQPGVLYDTTGYFSDGHFLKFRDAMKAQGHNVEIMIRGHDHPHAGFSVSQESGKIITLNNCLNADPARAAASPIGLGRYFPEKKLFEIHVLTAG